MAFNNLGPVTSIAPGAVHRWWYVRGGDFGFQHAGADVKTPGAELIAFDQSKMIDSGGGIVYHVSIRNIGSVPALYNLQGGGAA